MRLPLFLLLSWSCSVLSYKFLAYIPQFGSSHVNFLVKITTVLVDAGHEVVVVSPIIDTKVLNVRAGLKGKARVIEVPQCDFARAADADAGKRGGIGGGNMMWEAAGLFSIYRMFASITEAFVEQCNVTLTSSCLIEDLKKEKFDAAYTELFDMCSVGLFHEIGMENFAITQSTTMFGINFMITSAPDMPSYVPGLTSNFGEKMTFLERATNTFSLFLMYFIKGKSMAMYEAVMRKVLHDPLPVETLVQKSSLVFFNSEPLIDFPRLTTHKVLEIGGISVDDEHKSLEKKWDDILNLRPRTILFSFGTVALAHLMPEEYKVNLREAFRAFPDVTFIWKYEKPEHKVSQGVENIIETVWVPQKDMLFDPRLSAFITHGGQGSVTEATLAGVPLIVVPIAVDQLRNGQMIKRIQTGVLVSKDRLGDVETIRGAIKEILYNPKYAENARKTASMIESRPFPVKDIFLRNMELLAKHGPLRQLDHHSMELSFIEFYSVDVITAFASLMLAVIVMLYFLIKSCFRLIARSLWSKRKVE